MIGKFKSFTNRIFAYCCILFYPLNAAGEKTNVFFIHGANVSEQDARAWAATIFKGLYQAGANMQFYPIAWESDIGPDYNYYENVSNAFVTASFLAPLQLLMGRMWARDSPVAPKRFCCTSFSILL